MLNVLVDTGSTGTIETFLGYGSQVMTWIMTQISTIATFVMDTPMLAVFVLLSLIYAAFRIGRSLIRI